MSLIKTLLICVNVAVVFILIKGHSDEVVDSDCLQCLCHGATGCNLTLGCVSTSPNTYFCGPFHITWRYWADAGKPTVREGDSTNTEGFIECAKDMFCAAKTVRQYVKGFVKEGKGDCNGDGIVNCTDFAKMHRLGGYACKDPDNRKTNFYRRYDACWAEL